MSRYRKIEVRTWSDEKFRSLSPIPPSGQGLWFFLLTGPHTTSIPGLFRAGRAAMAEELGWSLKDFDEAFQEVFSQGMAKANFEAKLVWLPKAILHNKPASPNVVRGWRVELDLLPECDLKREAINAIREALIIAGTAYVAALDEVIDGLDWASVKPSGKPFDKPSQKTMPNQEQEQEQEQEKEEPIGSCRAEPDAKKPTNEQARKILDRLNTKTGKAFEDVPSNLTPIKARLKEYGEEKLIAVIDAKFAEWWNDEKMSKYLRPSTLFNAEKCAQYVGELSARKVNGKDWRTDPVFAGAC